MVSRSGFKIVKKDNEIVFFINGIWDFNVSKKLLNIFEKEAAKHKGIILDFANAKHVDFTAMSFLLLKSRAKACRNTNEAIQSLIDAFKNFYKPKQAPQKKKDFFTRTFESSRDYVRGFLNDGVEFLNFFGLMLFCLFLSILNPKRFRIQSLFYHLNEAGFKALPVALLTTFIVGGAISLQGAIQLQNMGAPLLSIDTTAKLSLREMGPFILALVLAGRSSSSFTAQIGVMNITEESNAMRVMNFNLMDFLIVPRFVALVIVTPLMVFLADAASIFAGMLAIKAQLGIGFLQYAERFYETVGWNNFLVGIIKAPFFGAAIALVGCFRGLQIRGDTEQVGKSTTTSVVNALFWIIFINAVFSVIFTRLDM